MEALPEIAFVAEAHLLLIAQMDASFKGFLLNLSVDEKLIKAMADAGYVQPHLFKSTFRNEDRLDAWLKRQLVDKKLFGDTSEEEWDFHPSVGALRTAWQSISPAKATVNVSAVDGSFSDQGSGVVSTIERLDLERNLLKLFPNEAVTDDLRPGLVLLTIVKRMVRKDSGLQHVPWSKVRSLEQEKDQATQTRKELENLARLGAQTRKELESLAQMKMLSEVSEAIDDADKSAQWQGGAYKMQRMLDVLMFALCTYGIGSLPSWRLFNLRFMSLFLKTAPKGLRSPNLQETMEAHALVMDAIFDHANRECYVKGDLSKLTETINTKVQQCAAHGGAMDDLMRPRVAEPKRPLPEGDKEEPPRKKPKCHFFAKGRCKKGRACDFSHEK